MLAVGLTKRRHQAGQTWPPGISPQIIQMCVGVTDKWLNDIHQKILGVVWYRICCTHHYGRVKLWSITGTCQLTHMHTKNLWIAHGIGITRFGVPWCGYRSPGLLMKLVFKLTRHSSNSTTKPTQNQHSATSATNPYNGTDDYGTS